MSSPQTFFYNSSPPDSPDSPTMAAFDYKSPAIRITAPEYHAPPATGGWLGRRAEHRRWKSVPANPPASRPPPRFEYPPFSYEYQMEDGRLPGLAQLDPERDHLHYSSSRNTSRNASARTSHDLDLSPRPSLDLTRTAFPSTPPQSPRRSGSITRALSIRHLTGRRSTDENRTRPRLGPDPPSSPFLKPDVRRPAASHGMDGPKPITSPIPSPQPSALQDAWEAPRPAPRPPQCELKLQRQKSLPLRHGAADGSLPPACERKTNRQLSMDMSAPETAPGTALTSQLRIETSPKLLSSPTRRPSLPRLQLPPSPRLHLPPSPRLPSPSSFESARPPHHRRKASKVVEYLDGTNTEKDKPRSPPPRPAGTRDFIPPVPPVPTFLPSVEWQLPLGPDSSGTGSGSGSPAPESLFNFTTKRASPEPLVNFALRCASPEPLINVSIRRSSSAVAAPPPSPALIAPATFVTSLAPKRERQQNMSLKRAAIYVIPRTPPPTATWRAGQGEVRWVGEREGERGAREKAGELKADGEDPAVKRSMSTRARPKPKMADVCMAEVKPVVLGSPVVAHGHARVISC